MIDSIAGIQEAGEHTGATVIVAWDNILQNTTALQPSLKSKLQFRSTKKSTIIQQESPLWHFA